MKRIADTDLNHENWDKMDEPEDRGTFKVADESTIAQRKVLSVRRKVANPTGVFKTFTGFSQNSMTPPSLPIFNNSTDINKEKHLNSLKSLNLKFVEAISKHISENPICVLSPLLDDYRKHLDIIKEKYPLPSTATTNERKESSIVSTSNSAPVFNFGKTSKEEEKPIDVLSTTNSNPVQTTAPSFSFNTSGPFTFGKPQQEETKNKPITISTPEISKPTPTLFGTSPYNSTDQGKGIFGFTADTKAEGFNPSSNLTLGNNLFGNCTTSLFAAQPANKTGEEDEEEYVPPVAEVREVKEQGSVYETRCKLYYKKENEWKERGVGNLYIKPLSTGKFQLVIRADNSLATILLNVLVNESTPMNTNKNNVSLVTMTDIDNKEPSPTSLLIRVKTPKQAEELLEEMKKQL